jgi:hypothetical protein
MLRLLILLLCLAPALSFAQDEEVEEVEEEVDPEVDTKEIYEDFKKSVKGESPSEEMDAWYGYLDTYSKSQFRLEIERRIEALEEAAFDELLDEQLEENDTSSRVDAKEAELDVWEPALTTMNANTRRRAEVGVVWGFNDFINYEANVEYAFFRRLSAFGGIRHRGVGGPGIGGALYGGVKGALIKDVRTGIVMSGALAVQFGFNPLDRAKFELEPWFGFAWLPSDKFQLQTSLSMVLRVDQLHTAVLWDIMAVIKPTNVFGVFIESKQKHSLYKPADLSLKYLAFYQAAVGAKIFPVKPLELTVGVNTPYFWRGWQDYRYIGINVGATIYFGKGPKK